jgi:hypothetical protein
MFTSPHELKQIKRLKIQREDVPMVHASLTGLGMYVVLSSLVSAVENLGFDTKTTQSIIDQIRKHTQVAFAQQLAEDGVDLHVVAYISNDIILPFFELIPKYFDKIIKRMESDARASEPFSSWGILGIVLRQALGEEKFYEIIGGNYFEFFPVQAFIDGMFSSSMNTIPEEIEELLRSPMGSEHGT